MLSKSKINKRIYYAHPFQPKIGELYYIVLNHDGKYGVHSYVYRNDSMDALISTANPIFQAAWEAYDYLYYLETMDEYKYTPKDTYRFQRVWYISYDKWRDKLKVKSSIRYSLNTPFIFKSKIQAQCAMYAARPRLVRKFMFNLYN